MGQRNTQEGKRKRGKKQVSRSEERRKSREGRLELETEHRGKKGNWRREGLSRQRQG